MSTETTTTVLKIQDQFSQPLQRYASELQRAEGASKDFGRSTGLSLSSLSQSFFFAVQNVQSLVNAFRQAYGVAKEWASYGVIAQKNEMALRALTGTSEEYRKEVEAIQRATRGAITESEAAATAYRLQRFGIADTAAEMEKFMHTISIVSAVNPQLGGTAEAINQIQLTLSNMSFMRLDQLGVSAGKVRERMAELKRETSGLSDENAFQQAVMEQLDEQANLLGDDILELTKNQDQMNAKWRELKDTVGKEANEQLELIAASIMDIVNALQTLNEMDFLPQLASGMGSAAVDWILGRGDNTATNTAARFAHAKDTLGWAQQGSQQYPTLPLTEGQTAQMQMYSRYLQTGAGGQNYWAQNTPDYVQASYAGRYDEYYRRQQEAGAGMTWANPQQFQPQVGAIPNAIGTLSVAGQTAWNQYSQARATALPPGQIAGDMAGKIDFAAAEEHLKNAARSSAEIERNLSGAAQEWGSLNEKFGVTTTGYDVDVFNEMSGALRDVGVESDQAQRAMTAYELATGMATGSSVLFDERLTDLTQQFADGKLSVDEYTQGVQALGQSDLSWVDSYAEKLRAAGASTDQINTAMQSLSDNWQKNYTAQGKGTEGGKGGGTEGGAAGDMFTAIQKGSEQALSSVQTFSDQGQQAFTELSSVATEQIGTIDGALTALDGRTVDVNLLIHVSDTITGGMGYDMTGGGQTGAGGLPGRAGGGDVRGGGLYRVTEGQIPELFEGNDGQQYLMAPRGGGRVIAPQFASSGAGGGEAQIVIPLYIDKEKVGEAVAEVSRTRGAKTR